MGLVLGIDTGFSTMGLSLMEVSSTREYVMGGRTLTTKKSAKKLNIRASDDNMRRAREIAVELRRRLDTYDINAVCMEAQSWPRNASSSAKIGISWGIVAAVAEAKGLPVLQATPQAIKKALVGKNSASKDEIIAAITKRHPEIKWPKAKGIHEHIADATGAVIACMDSDIIRMVRQLP